MTDSPLESLLATFGDMAEDVGRFRDEVTVFVRREHSLAALELAQRAGFLLLTDLTAVDRHPSQPRFEIVYLLTAPRQPARLRLKVRVSADDPVVPSATSLWAGANWLEREVFDLFGLRFDGHPDLRRILMPDDWEGHPLRKDFSLVEEPVEFIGHTPKVPSRIIPKSEPRQQ